MQRSATVEVLCMVFLAKYTVSKKRCSHFFDDPVKELAPAHELQYHVKVPRVIRVESVNLYHVRVVELIQDAHLPRNRRYVCRI